MTIKRFNIAVPKEYEKDGETKTAWGNVGKMVRFGATNEKPESFLIELNMFPNTKFMLFEEKPKDVVSEKTIQTEEEPF